MAMAMMVTMAMVKCYLLNVIIKCSVPPIAVGNEEKSTDAESLTIQDL